MAHLNIRIPQTMVSGIPLVLGLNRNVASLAFCGCKCPSSQRERNLPQTQLRLLKKKPCKLHIAGAITLARRGPTI